MPHVLKRPDEMNDAASYGDIFTQQKRYSTGNQKIMRNWRHGHLDRVLTVILVFTIIGGIGAISYKIANPGTQEVFTEFYLLGPEGKAYGYPSELNMGEAGNIMLGIVNQEHQSMSYLVELILGGELNAEIGPIALVHKETWQETVQFIPQKPGRDQMVKFLLYKIRNLGDEHNKHTSLCLWLGRENLKTIVSNTGTDAATYEIKVKVNARLGEPDKQETGITSAGPVVLAPGEEWKVSPEYTYPQAIWQNAEFSLYRDGRLIYRGNSLDGYPELHLWINVTGTTG